MAVAETLTTKMGNDTTANIMQYRGHISILKQNYRQQLFKDDPTHTTIYENAGVAKMDITNTKHSVTGVNKIAQKAEKKGQEEAKSILEKFSQSVTVDNIKQDAEGFNPIKSFADFENFEKSKPQSVLEAEKIARSEDQQEALNKRVGTEEPSANSKPFGYADNFKDKEAALNLLKTCIPCEFRKLNFSAEFGLPWANTLDDLKKKWKDLLRLLKDLLAFKSGEFSKDLCNLFKFLDGQCIPDILGLMSLLSMMQLKYADLGLTSLNNILTQLITPFLSPIIGNFTSNLDKFSDLIIGPLKCVVNALEFQLNNIESQINGAVNIADKNRSKYYQKELDFFDRKAKSLRNRKLTIQAQENKSKQDLIELETIDTELSNLSRKRKGLLDDIKKLSGSQVNAVDFSKATTVTQQTRFALNNMEKAYKSILGDLVDAVNDGISLVKQSVDIYREEFQRMVMGRVTTQEDQIEFTRMLQNIARLQSIVRAVYDFKKAGFNLKKFCDRGSDNALAQIAKQLKTSNNGMFDFYQATDSDGNALMVIAPGGAKLSVTGIDFDAIGDDSLIGVTSIDSLKKTVSFNDLNEVDKLNREGIVPDLGNIDSKNIELDNGFRQGSELDLHFKTSYAIISNEFCSKSAIDFGSSDTVKQWAANLWQKE